MVNIIVLTEGTASATVPQNYAAKVTASGGNCQLMLITISQASKNHPFLGDPTMSAIVPVVGSKATI